MRQEVKPDENGPGECARDLRNGSKLPKPTGFYGKAHRNCRIQVRIAAPEGNCREHTL